MKGTVIILILCSWGAPTTSAAQENPDSEQLIHQALELRRSGDSEGAVEVLEHALARDPSGRVHAQLGFARQELGEWVDAYRHLEVALASQHPWVEEHRTTIQESLALIGQYVGRLDIRTDVEGAEVFLDGIAAGIVPWAEPALVRAGRIDVRVEAEGYRAVSRTVAVRPGELSRETIDLRPETIESPTVPTEDNADRNDVIRDPDRSTELPERDGRRWRIGGYTLGSAGAALGIISLFLYVQAQDDRDHYNSAECVGNGMTRDENCGDFRSSALRNRNLSAALLAIGGGAVISGIVMVLLSSRNTDREQAWACTPSADFRGASCAIRF